MTYICNMSDVCPGNEEGLPIRCRHAVPHEWNADGCTRKFCLLAQVDTECVEVQTCGCVQHKSLCPLAVQLYSRMAELHWEACREPFSELAWDNFVDARWALRRHWEDNRLMPCGHPQKYMDSGEDFGAVMPGDMVTSWCRKCQDRG